MLKKELLDILVCPVDKKPLKELEKEMKLECSACGRKYPVKDGIPVMLIDEAELPPKSK
ncbi:MAG: Trm112 family protein [Lentisphaerae bacterium]|nr:Trm112 family protein [Lentisphaerota bacterium]